MSLDPLRLSEREREREREREISAMHRIVGGKETGGYARRAASSERRSRCSLVVGNIQRRGKRRGAISIGQEREIRGRGTAQDAWLRRARRGLGMGTVKSGYACRVL